MSMMKELFTKYTDEIAWERYGMEFYQLPDETQNVVIEMANNRAKDLWVDECDYD